ncbi:MAG: tRNA dimethylallyltransferase [Methylococcaceae bacterium]|nr:tRNA dimethylallyltransferase [Methylococcaceae bacterium]
MGPTASGKSTLAVQLAQSLGGEIISVDSALVYREMNIGTAKPTLVERGGIPHHLIDILDPSDVFSTGQFRVQTLELVADICQRGRIPILVGGTMLYPESAARIHPNDPQRIQRALEVYEISGKPLSAFFTEEQSQKIPYRLIKLIISPAERQTLHDIIAKRFMHMLDQGFIEEVERLIKRGDLNGKMPSIRAVGYRQIWAYLHGEYDKTAMIEKGIAATRQLAKRQFTWLRRETEAFQLLTGDTFLLKNALATINKALND